MLGLLLAAGRAAWAQGSEGEGGVTLSGSVKGLLLRSETPLDREAFALGLNRLRLQAQGPLAPWLALDLQLDEELLVGSYLRTAQFQHEKDQPPPQYWHADANTFERHGAYGRQRLHRASLTFSIGEADLRLGRQRIAWGTGRFWSPLDILNPVSPVAIEREERLGVDAALLEARFGPLSRLSIVYAPRREPGLGSRALQWHANAAAIDYSMTAGRLAGADVAGLDLAGQLGQAGMRAEIARLRPEGGRAQWRAMLGADYAFANTLTLSAELYDGGEGARRAGLFIGYDITPLLKWANYLVANLGDRSRGADIRLVWSVRPDVDLTLGLQRFDGRAGSEYGQLRSATFAQAQWFF